MICFSFLLLVQQTNPHKTIFGPVAKYWPVSLVQTSTGALTAWDEAIRDARDEFVTRRVCNKSQQMLNTQNSFFLFHHG